MWSHKEERRTERHRAANLRAQELPKAAQDPPPDGPRPPPKPSWNGLKAGHRWLFLLRTVLSNQIENQTVPGRSGSDGVPDLGSVLTPKTTPRRPQDDPKTSEKCNRKMHRFFYGSWTRLEPVLRRSRNHPDIKKVAKTLRFPLFFEDRHF